MVRVEALGGWLWRAQRPNGLSASCLSLVSLSNALRRPRVFAGARASTGVGGPARSSGVGWGSDGIASAVCRPASSLRRASSSSSKPSSSSLRISWARARSSSSTSTSRPLPSATRAPPAPRIQEMPASDRRARRRLCSTGLLAVVRTVSICGRVARDLHLLERSDAGGTQEVRGSGHPSPPCVGLEVGLCVGGARERAGLGGVAPHGPLVRQRLGASSRVGLPRSPRPQSGPNSNAVYCRPEPASAPGRKERPAKGRPRLSRLVRRDSVGLDRRGACFSVEGSTLAWRSSSGTRRLSKSPVA